MNYWLPDDEAPSLSLVWESKRNSQLDLCWLKAHAWETDLGLK